MKKLLALLLALTTGCGGDDPPPPADTLSQRERQEMIGKSSLPGAQGVTGALGASDSAKARAARLDSALKP